MDNDTMKARIGAAADLVTGQGEAAMKTAGDVAGMLKPVTVLARGKKLDGPGDRLRERFLSHCGNADAVRQELAAGKDIHVHLRMIDRAVQRHRQALQAEALACVRFETPPGRQEFVVDGRSGEI